jgi:trk system potassium uptake protein TrkA
MTKRFAVIGLGYFGERLALELTARGAEVIAIDNRIERVEDIKDKVACSIKLDSTDERALRSQGLEDLDAVIVTIGENFESALLTCVLLMQFGCRRVIARSTAPIHTIIFKSVGVDTVISPEELVAERLSYSLITENLLDLIPVTGEYSIVQVKAPSYMIGKTLADLDVRKRYDVNLITIKRTKKSVDKKGKEVIEEYIAGVPKADQVILQDDTLIILGRERDIQKLIED